jgi:hypothetical protein
MIAEFCRISEEVELTQLKLLQADQCTLIAMRMAAAGRPCAAPMLYFFLYRGRKRDTRVTREVWPHAVVLHA